MMNLNEIVRTTNAEVLFCDEDCKTSFELEKPSTDTRTIKSGDLYLPLKGASFDGEEFIQQAIEKGAIGYFTTSNKIIPNAKFALKVKDTKQAYLELANFRLKQISPKVILITGSSGKTTTKELVSSVVSKAFDSFKTPLNHNNEIGFCQTIFDMPDNTQVLVLEAGMRGLGEISLISQYTQPDITIISNVGTAHIGRLGSRENIAKAKCEVVEFQKNNGVFIGHNDELIKSNLKFNGQKIFYSINDTEIIDKKIGSSIFRYKNTDYTLNIEGDYNIENSISAIEVGLALGMKTDDIKQGLFEYKPIEKRWEIETVGGYNIINDSYNANPESMKATLKTMFDLYPDAVIVLGDMGELGENEAQYHREVGEYIKTSNAKNKIITVGKLAKEISDKHNFETNIDVSKYITNNIEQGATIFLKASRSGKLEEIINYIKENV